LKDLLNSLQLYNTIKFKYQQLFLFYNLCEHYDKEENNEQKKRKQ